MATETEEKPTSGPRKPVPTPLQKRIMWRALTGISIAVIAILGLAAIVILGKTLGFLQPVLVPLAMAGILAYLLDPVVRWARQRKFFGRDLSRLQAMLLVFFLATAAMVFLGFRVVVPASKDLGKLFDNKSKIISGAEETLSKLNSGLISFEDKFGIRKDAEENDNKEEQENQGEDTTPSMPISEGDTGSPFDDPATAAAVVTKDEDADVPDSQLWREFLGWLQSPDTAKAALAFLGKAANGFFGAIGYIIGFFLVPVYLFFFLKDAAAIREQWTDYVPLRQSSLKDELVAVLTEVNGYLIAYFRGQVVVSVIDGAATGIILALMGLDYALVIGVALAVLGIVPFVGFIVTAIPAIVIAAAQAGNWQYPLAVALVFIAVQQIDGLFIQPKIVGESVGLHPLTVIFSVLFWSLLIGGVLGALLAVPLTAGVKVLFRRYIWEQKIRPNVLPPDEPPPVEATA